MCRRRGSLLWFAPREAFQLTTDPADVATYHFNKAHIDHHHCRECGIAPYSEAVDPHRYADGGGERALRAAGGSGRSFGDLLQRGRAVRPLRAWTRVIAMPVLLLALAACARNGERAAEAGATAADAAVVAGRRVPRLRT
jgi:hypothetical protein